jgi:N-acetylglucosamine kinase-like BadF-type ATPase
MNTHLTRAVLALDPGGSKCDAVLVGDDGTVVGWSHMQKPGLSGRSPEIISAATAKAIGQHTFDELHVATFGSALPPRIVRPEVIGRGRMWPLTQACGPLALTGQTHGVVVLAGTGALVSACTRQGRKLALDGLGPLLGDFGSGYFIGLQALRATARAVLHPRNHTSLKERVFTACEVLTPHPTLALNIPSPVQDGRAKGTARQANETQSDNGDRLARLVTFSLMAHDRSTIASLAKIVDEEARTGDAVAIRILENAATAIGETLRDLLDQLQIANEKYPLVGTGSVAMNSDIFWNHLCRLVSEQAPRFTATRCPAAPVLGNALFVLRELRPEAVDTIRKTLLATAPKGDTTQ